MKNKNKSLEELKMISSKLRKKGKKIVHCHGVFDLLHLGHIRHFEKSKSLGDVLIVSITHHDFVNKSPNQPYFSTIQRIEMLNSIEVIDYVCVNKNFDATELINLIKPSFYCKGADYKIFSEDITGKINDETKAVESVGGEFIVTDEISFSSSKLLLTENIIINEDQNFFLKKLKKLNSLDDISNLINNFKNLNILVIGETIIDEYTYCEAIGKSGKDPFLVLKKLNTERYLGGVLALANNISEFSNNVSLVSILGKNKEYYNFIKNNLSKKIKKKFFLKNNSETILKKRFVDKNSNNKVMGVYNLFDDQVNEKEILKINDYLNKILHKYDLVIVVDYGHGFLSNSTIKLITNKSKFLSINCQVNSSNSGFQSVQKYNKSNILTINESELRFEMRDKRSKVEYLVNKLSKKIKFNKCVVTRGSKGALLYDAKKNIFLNCPAFAGKVVDKVGAGDTFLPFFTFATYLKSNEHLALFLGSVAAADSVLSIANSKKIKKNKILKTISHLIK
jgi:rfaE bifunctional protein kinase chain/domain